ncbi:hypothetical protein [Bartonella sp. MU70NMGDW]|uniref:hypothetical protein n=1 Tax=Bartonella sp. MU70NMGDW TaxID=3243561 RepID=UPI0035CEC3D2
MRADLNILPFSCFSGFFLSVCIFATIPVVVILREILTHRLKKKIQQLEEVTEETQ